MENLTKIKWIVSLFFVPCYFSLCCRFCWGKCMVSRLSSVAACTRRHIQTSDTAHFIESDISTSILQHFIAFSFRWIVAKKLIRTQRRSIFDGEHFERFNGNVNGVGSSHPSAPNERAHTHTHTRFSSEAFIFQLGHKNHIQAHLCANVSTRFQFSVLSTSL